MTTGWRSVFDPLPAPAATSSDTSVEAAIAIAPRLNHLQAFVLNTIRCAGHRGMTRDEIETTVSLRGNTIRPRVKELLSQGAIVVGPETRVTASGRRAEVLIAKEFSRD